MSTSLTVRDIDPADKSWLRREARHGGVSMEEFVRRLIHETGEFRNTGVTTVDPWTAGPP